MSRYYLRVANGKYSGAPDVAIDAGDDAAAWQEMVQICSDLIGDVCRGLKQNSDWELELFTEHNVRLFRIRLVSESLT